MKHLFSSVLFFISFFAAAQDVDLSLFKGMNMRYIGPGTMSGRVTAIDVVRDNPETIFAGTASGGVWKSVSGGISWKPVFDDMPTQSIGALTIAPSNPDVIYAGTGEGNPRNSHSSGAGVFKSVDGGETWSFMGLAETKTIHRIVVHKNNPDLVWVAAMGSVWGKNAERGVYASKDGGKTWTKSLYINDQTGCADLVVDPRNPNKMFAAMWEYGRKPWTFNSGGLSSGLYVTYNGGESWKELDEDAGLPDSELGRIGLAIAHSNPDVVYALVESKKTALYRSDDGGKNWKSVATKNIGNRPFYYADIFVDPSDENTLFNLYSVVTKSIDGGKNFEVILPYYGVHPDHHAFYIHPDNPDFIVNGNDGGLNISRDGGDNWEFISNLPVGQFYHVNVDRQTPYNVYGGLQDNGSWKGPGFVWQNDGIRNENWQEISFGDGFDVVPDADNPDYAYAMYQGGNVNHINMKTGAMRFVQPVSPDTVPLRFNWNAAIAANPHNPKSIYFGSQFLHKSNDKGASWDVISPDLTTNNPEKQKQAKSGGLTIDATQAENHTTITCIAPGVISQNTIWVGSDDGYIHVTFDGGANWKRVSDNIKGFPKECYVTQIHPSAFNDKEAFVTANNYRLNDWGTYVYHTTDGGVKWTRLAGDGSVRGHAHAIVQDIIEPNLLFLGTEGGLFLSFNKGKSWQQWKHDYPSVCTIDMKIQPVEDDLVIATFGRGCYILDAIEPLRKAAKLDEKLVAFKSPPSYQASYIRPAGSRFLADHVWEGDNKPSGAVIQFFLDPEMVDTTGKKKVTARIFSNTGDTLRTLTMSPDSGVNRMVWYFDTKGVEWPSRRKREGKEEVGGGFQVAPGTYKVELAYEKMTATTEVNVFADPRTPLEAGVFAARAAYHTAVLKEAERAGKSFKQLMEAKEVIDLVRKQVAMFADSTYKPVSTMADSLSKTITKLENEFMLADDFEGYDHVTKHVNDYLWDAMSYEEGVPSKNADRALEIAQSEVEAIVSKVNDFFDGEWKTWKTLCDEMEWKAVKSFPKVD